MNIAVFKDGVNNLSFLPIEEMERAIVIAEGLGDDDRQDLFDQLEKMNEELGSIDEKEQKAVEALEHTVIDIEKSANRTKKEEQESYEHDEEVEEAEKKLTEHS